MAERSDCPECVDEVYDSYLSMGTLLANDLGRPDEAERMYLQAIEIHEQHAARVPSEPFTPSDRTKAYDSLTGLLIRVGRRGEAADISRPRVESRSQGSQALLRRGGAVPINWQH